MDRMNGLDAMFLAAETPTMPLHVTAALVLERTAAAPAAAGTAAAPRSARATRGSRAAARPWFADEPVEEPPFMVVRELIERRIGLVPALRRRSVPVPFGLDHPVWVDDPRFRLDEHLRRVRLPSPGGQRELAELVADMAARPLDRGRPLWELAVAEGLDSGHLVVVPKLHHAVADGVLGTEIISAFLDGSPRPLSSWPDDAVSGRDDAEPGVDGSAAGPDDTTPGPWAGEPLPAEHDLLAGAFTGLAREPQQWADALVRSAMAARDLTRHHRRLREEDGRPPPPVPFAAPATSISGPLSAQRAFAFTEVPVEDVTVVRRAFGGTVNDVLLSVVGGALRRLLHDRGEQLADPLVAMVPRSTRPDGTGDAPVDAAGAPDGGNRLSAMLVSLGSTVADPVVRLRVVSEGARMAKEQTRLVPDALVQGWARLAVPAMSSRASRLVSNLRLFGRTRPVFNAVVSNVRGPAAPLWLAGHRLVAVYPSGPVAEGAGVNVTAISYLGTMFVGVTTCRRLVPEAWALADHLTDGFAALVKAAAEAGNWCP
jgi:WS/DGAT/MGAT family acyltransferase